MERAHGAPRVLTLPNTADGSATRWTLACDLCELFTLLVRAPGRPGRASGLGRSVSPRCPEALHSEATSSAVDLACQLLNTPGAPDTKWR